MAYHIDPENGDIVLDGFDKGVADDPYSGLGDISQCSIAVPNEISVGYTITANATSGATLGIPIARSTRFFNYGTPGIPAGTSAQSFAIVDKTGQVFEATSYAGTWTFLANGNTTISATTNIGLAYWLGYLWKFQGVEVYYWNNTVWAKLSTTSAGYTITTDVPHFAYVASDNVLYFTNNGYVGSITAPTPTAFDPTNTATYSFSNTKLQLPVTDVALSLAEVGGGNAPQSTLLIGGSQNAIYPWDKVSSSFNLPIYIAETYIGRMVSVNQNAFIFPGNQNGRGRIYITNGSQANLYFKIPDFITTEQEPYFVWGDAIYHRNNLLFGFVPFQNSGSSDTGVANDNVWAIDLDTKVFRPVSILPSASLKGNANCLISLGSVSSPGFGYIVGWDDRGSVPSIGYSGTVAGIGGATFNTDLIPIGTLLNPKTTAQIEFKVRTPLRSGESIAITAFNNSGNSTVLSTIVGGAVGDISGYYTSTVEKSQWLGLRVSIVGNSATGGGRLYEIRIR